MNDPHSKQSMDKAGHPTKRTRISESDLYRECHEHLRDADRKRDQLVAFYAIVIGFLFSAYRFVPTDLLPLVGFVLGLIGIGVVMAVIQYRKWHFIYSNCFRALQDLSWMEEHDVEKAWSNLAIRRPIWDRLTIISPFNGTEAATFQIVVVLSFLPWYLALKDSNCALSVGTGSHLLPFFLGVLVYGAMMNGLGLLIYMQADGKRPFDHWILRSLRPKVDDLLPRYERLALRNRLVFWLVSLLFAVITVLHFLHLISCSPRWFPGGLFSWLVWSVALILWLILYSRSRKHLEEVTINSDGSVSVIPNSR